MIAKTFIAALIVLPFFAQSALAACTRSYTVQPGDICDSISAAHNVSTYQLAVVNAGIVDSGCTNLMPGETICLGNEGEDCSITHLVVPGDTCDGIMQVAGINSTMLYGNNPQINAECSNIYVGEVLCTANQIQVPPAPAGAPTPATAIPSTAAAANPTPSVASSAPPAAAPPAATTPAVNNDDNLPFCDEL